MKHLKLMIMAACMMPALAFTQTVKEKLDQVKKDPATTERSAQADARIVNKKQISDSASTTVATKPNKTACKHRKKRKP